uniref:Minor tail protein n=1 Tax=Mycobacterium phage BabyBack TaxID=3158877 RepID=A0AAU8GRD9_9CAUD
MNYVIGLCIVYGLLTWILLVCEHREEAERADEATSDEASGEAEAVR